MKKVLSNRPILFGPETALLIALAALDVILTHRLLAGRHVEANPLAAWVLMKYGMRGMVVYKFVLIAIICVLAQTIALYRRSSALMVMWIGVIAHGLVVIYSFFQVLGN